MCLINDNEANRESGKDDRYPIDYNMANIVGGEDEKNLF